MCACVSTSGWFEIFVDILTVILIPIIGVYISCREHKRNVYHTKIEFLTQGNTEAEKDRRKKLYDRFEEKNHILSEQDFKELDSDGDLGKIISFYDMWASMVKMNYLPLKSFEGANGITAVKLFYILLPYINYRRKSISEIPLTNENIDKTTIISNEAYAVDFEWLINKIIEKKYISVSFHNDTLRDRSIK